MPVGTQASVKALDPLDLRSVGAEIILANTYHLSLRPGADLIAELGGIASFMRWDGPVLMDSGGYQIFSLASNRRISTDGVTFRSHIDGSEYHLTPERAIEQQLTFDTDILMALDVCAGYDADDAEQCRAMELTHLWLPRNIEAFNKCKTPDGCGSRLLFGICQGGFHARRRHESAQVIAAAGTDGCAIGGLSVGEPKPIMAEMLDASISELPKSKPRYLMGVGSPEDLWSAVAVGVDMFDCVLPTRVARHGGLYTPRGRVNLRAARYRKSDVPVDPDCDCYTCRTFSAAYIHHLYRANELLVYRLATIHNLRFIMRQMETMRLHIEQGTFGEAHRAFSDNYAPANQRVAASQRQQYKQSRQ